VIVAVGAVFIVTLVFAVLEHPVTSVKVYTIVCVVPPNPVGLKVVPETPVPEKVPPAGVPFKVTLGELEQTLEIGDMVTTGLATTSIFLLSDLTQPLPSVYVYVIVDVVPPNPTGLNVLPDTPVPLKDSVPPAPECVPERVIEAALSQIDAGIGFNNAVGNGFTVIETGEPDIDPEQP
jgi:hypothetical protein